MAENPFVNKVVFGDQTIIDISDSTVNPDVLLSGYTAYKSNGEKITGINEYKKPKVILEGAPNGIKISDDLIVDNFTSGGYAYYTNVMIKNYSPNKIDITVKFLFTQGGRTQVLFGSKGSYYYFPSIEVSDNTIWGGFSTNGSSWTSSIRTTTPLQSNTWYYVNYLWENNSLTISVYDENKTLLETKTVITSGRFYESSNSSASMELGGINSSSSHNAQYVKIDLKETYFKFDDELVWGIINYIPEYIQQIYTDVKLDTLKKFTYSDLGDVTYESDVIDKVIAEAIFFNDYQGVYLSPTDGKAVISIYEKLGPDEEYRLINPEEYYSQWSGVGRGNYYYIYTYNPNKYVYQLKINFKNTYRVSGNLLTGVSRDEIITNGMPIIKRMGSLKSQGWYFNTNAVLWQDLSDPDCVLDVFKVKANHKYIFCYGGTKVGNRCTVAFTTQDILNNPTDGLQCTKKWSSSSYAIPYYSQTIFDISEDGYIGAYIANKIGTNVESYLIDITDLGVNDNPEYKNYSINFDFTDSLTDLVEGEVAVLGGSASRGNNGVFLSNNDSYIQIPSYLLRKSTNYVIKVKSMSITSTSVHNRFFVFTGVNPYNSGLIYRSTGYWGIYDNTNGWQMSNISDKNFFNDCEVRIHIDKDYKWHIYRNEVLVFEPENSIEYHDVDLYIGAGQQGCSEVLIESLKIY